MVEVKNEKRIGMVDYFGYGNITFQKKLMVNMLFFFVK